MINPRKFALLGTKQKIYKIASTIRNMEIDLKHGKSVDIKETLSYADVIRTQEGRKLAEAAAIVDGIKDFEGISSFSEKIKALNFAYHDLLSILEQKADEDKKFSFIQFDDNEREAVRYPYIAILDNLRDFSPGRC